MGDKPAETPTGLLATAVDEHSDLPFDQTRRARQALRTLPDLPALTLGEGDAVDLSLGELLGEGGMGVVRVARQRALERDVAVKRLREGAPPETALALIHEARIMGAVEHPNVIPVHALGADAQGSPTLVMKRVEGVVWRTLIREPDHPAWKGAAQWSPDPLVRHVEILIEVCKAMQFAHSRGVIHRDLKPDNVMLGPFGEVYVLDWGVASRLADFVPGPHSLVGTPAYLAPEMVDLEGRHDARTDVFLLGGCLHEALTRAVPHQGATLRDILDAAAASRPRSYDPAIPAELAAICNRAMAADPARRFADVARFRAALVDFLRHRGSDRLTVDAWRLFDQALALPVGDPGRVPLLREAQFAFRQALREWPDNPEAREGLVQLLGVEVRARMARSDYDGASQALRDLDSLDALPDDLVREVGRARADWDALRARTREVDPRVGRGARVALITAVVVLGTGFSVAQWERVSAPWLPYGPGLLFLYALPVVLGMGAAILGARKALLQNAISRRIALFEMAAGLVILGNRGIGWLFGTSAAQALAIDDLIIAFNCACVGLFVRPQLTVWGLPWLAAAATTPFFPSLAGELFTAAGVLNYLLMRFQVRWDRPLSEAMPPAI